MRLSKFIKSTIALLGILSLSIVPATPLVAATVDNGPYYSETISGTVSINGAPYAGATVRVVCFDGTNNTSASANLVSDASGRYRVSFPRYDCHHDGYVIAVGPTVSRNSRGQTIYYKATGFYASQLKTTVDMPLEKTYFSFGRD